MSVHAELPYKMVGVTVPLKRRSRPFTEYDFVVSSRLSRKNFLHPAAILFSTSVWVELWKENRRPRYFCEEVCGSTSTFMSLILTCSGCCRGRRCCWLCNILVLSGWSSSPTRRASLHISSSILLSCRRFVEKRSTSSAKRKFVIIVVLSCSPARRVLHLGLSLRKMDSERQLKSSELSGSPCFVPRCMLNSRLSTSVSTVAV